MVLLQSATDAFLKESTDLLAAPLPAVYTASPTGGPPEPVEGPGLLGPRADLTRLREITKDLDEGMAADVLAPVEQWLFAWQAVRKRVDKLEEVRIDIDSRRRVVRSLQQKSESQRSGIARATSERGRGKLEQSLEATWRMVQHKEAKLSMALDHFAQFEAEVSEELSGLINDAVCLKSYLSACMELEREAFRAAGRALYDEGGDGGSVSRDSAGAGGRGRDRRSRGPSGGAGAGAGGGQPPVDAADKGDAPNPFEEESADMYEARIAAGQGKRPSAAGSAQMYGDDIQLPAPENYPSPRWDAQ